MRGSGHGTIGWRAAALVGAALLLGACENNLIFLERAGFNLSISVNDDPATPIEVNAGLKRVIVALVPPQGDPVKTETGARANGEAVTMVSGYDLHYAEAVTAATATTPASTSWFGGTLTIRTQFASGVAAETLASNPKAVNKVVGVKSRTLRHVPDDLVDQVVKDSESEGATVAKTRESDGRGWMVVATFP